MRKADQLVENWAVKMVEHLVDSMAEQRAVQRAVH